MVKNKSGIAAKGVSNETLDGIKLKTLQKISKEILNGTIKFSPVRRVLIPKPGKTELRPLGVSSPREKIIQKSIDLVLTAIYEEIFLDCSHGSRPNRSCHSALKHLQIKIGNAGTYTWVIEGDIKGCFDNIPHSMILKGLRLKVDCPTTIGLIKKILNAGYILDEDLKKYGRKKAKVHKSDIGTPQGIVLSPLFSNIVLHQLDVFIQEEAKKKFTQSNKKRKVNLEYRKLTRQIQKEEEPKKKRKLINERLKVPSKDMSDPNYNRLYYVRYVDD